MQRATLNFFRLAVDDQVIGPDEFLVARVFLTVAVSDKMYPDVVIEVRQPMGDTFATGALQISKPDNYDGPWGFTAFQNAVERYYRGLVGPKGKLICFGPEIRNLKMSKCQADQPERIVVDLPELKAGGGGW